MGNYRFRLSDMMPNAWFYKLKDMSRTRNRNPSHSIKKKQPPTAPPPQQQQQQQQQTQPKQSHFSHPRNSYYFSTESRVGDSFYNSPSNPKFSDTHFPDPPRKSSKRSRAKRRTIKSSSKLVTSSVSAGCSCRATIDSVWTTKPDSTPDYSPSLDTSPEHDVPEFAVATTDPFGGLGSWSSSCSCRVSSSATDIIIDMDEKSLSSKFEKVHGFDSISELDLPPILTKPVKFYDMINDMKKNKKENSDEPTKFRRNLAKLEEKIADETRNEPTKFRRNLAKLEEKIAHESLCVKVIKEESIKTVKEQKTSPAIRRSSSAASPGMKLRANSPRIASRKIQAYNRKSISSSTATSSTRSRRKNISESFAIVKSSFNPQKDFKDSMVEMIVENNIRASKDLEDLLACYLSLNSNEYHDLIVKVFEQIWFDMTDIHL